MRVILLLLALCRLNAAWVPEVAVVTAYTPFDPGSPMTGLTATGAKTADRPYGLATDWGIAPAGTVIYVPGYDEISGSCVATVDDTGGAMRQDARRGVFHIDLRMKSKWNALQWGRRKMTVWVFHPDTDDP